MILRNGWKGAGMKAFWLLAALCTCATALAQSPQSFQKVGRFGGRGGVRNQATPSAGCWCRTPDGRWLWVTGTRELPNGQTAMRTYSYYRPPATIYGDDGRPQVIAGIDWYLNGRGPFSD